MRYAIGIEYDGSLFFGWQVQAQEPTVQSAVETALSRVANENIRVVCSGRTDTGVHALCQVAHFETVVQRPDHSWVLGANRYLPSGVSLLWLREVDEGFHARFSAISRTYQYRIINRQIRPALDAKRMAWCRKPLSEKMMHEAAQVLVGEHDFSAFRASACQALHAVREISKIEVRRHEDEVNIEITANGFLYHMVRNIAGCLMSIGCGDQPPQWLKMVLESQDRTLAAATASACGLYFRFASYPDQYEIPVSAVDFELNGDQI